MQERHSNREQYFSELSETCQKYYIPYIEQFISITPDLKILEVGCGEGGNLEPFAKRGCKVIGVDLCEQRIEEAKLFFKDRNLSGEFIASDIFKLKSLENQFDLIIIHDVIEHIFEKKEFLEKIKPYLSEKGIIYIGFPAWQMPFGGHQQICESKIISHLPFMHLLPKPLYKLYLKIFENDKTNINELLDIKRCKCSIELFKRVVAQSGFSIINQTLYFINPHYEAKFGLKPRLLNSIISKIPYIRNFFTTSCFYIIAPAKTSLK